MDFTNVLTTPFLLAAVDIVLPSVIWGVRVLSPV